MNGDASIIEGRPIRILRLINGLEQGGAEESLYKLTLATKDADTESLVVSLGANGMLRAGIERAGATVVELRFSRIPTLAKLLALIRVARQWRPDIIEGWMIHSNVLACLLLLACPGARVVWNIRSSLSLSTERFLTRLLMRLGLLLSRSVSAIVYNSESIARQHEAFGYPADRTWVIPNGFDTGEFVFSAEGATVAKGRLGLAAGVNVIGHVSRWHGDKDHHTLLAAFARVLKQRADTILILAGAGLESTNAALMTLIDAHHLRHAVVLLGRIDSPSALYPALDAFVLTSIREGFPNVIGEAMACGVPCVATDVGGCREVVGDSAVFSVGDSEGISNALVALIDLPHEERVRRAVLGRERIVRLFGLAALGQRYLALYAHLVRAAPAARTGNGPGDVMDDGRLRRASIEP